MGNKAVNYPHALEFVPQCNKTKKKKKNVTKLLIRYVYHVMNKYV